MFRRVSDSSTIFEHFTSALHSDDLHNNIENNIGKRERILKLNQLEIIERTKTKRSVAAMQDKTRQDKTRQDETRQDKTRQDKTRQDKTRQDKV